MTQVLTNGVSFQDIKTTGLGGSSDVTSSSSSTCSSVGGTGVGGASHGGMGAGGHKHKGGQLLPEGEEISNRDLEEQVNL